MSRPIQPSVIKQLAQLMALLDPRCDFEAHNKVAQGEQCPNCKLDLFTYIQCLPQAWPL
jgi:hypothetical protein